MPPIIYNRTHIDDIIVQQISVDTLLSYPIWNGNRFVDQERVKELKKKIKNINDLHFIYHAIKYNDESGEHIDIVDGQHRINVIKESIYNKNNFVLLVLKKVNNDDEAIEYFNKINNIKPQHFDDKKNIANSYISALIKEFPNSIRTNAHRPNLCVNKLREYILEYNVASVELDADKFVSLAKEQNEILLTKLNEKLQTYPEHSKRATIKKYISNKFALPFPDHLDWLKEIKLAA